MSALQQPLNLPLEKRNFAEPDETRLFNLGKIELVTIGGVTFGRATFLPGWRWTTCIGPVAKTENCEVSHLSFQISGHLHISMNDGAEADLGPGDLVSIPPGHDAWVVGDEPVVVVDIPSMTNYANR